jgi:putative membrane protein
MRNRLLEICHMLHVLLQWVLSAVSLILLTKLLPGFRIKNFGTAMIVAAVYGVLHVLLYRILVVIAFIPVFLTFGLFVFIIDAFLLFLTDKLLEDFEIDNLFITLIAAVLLTLLNGIWRWLFF